MLKKGNFELEDVLKVLGEYNSLLHKRRRFAASRRVVHRGRLRKNYPTGLQVSKNRYRNS